MTVEGVTKCNLPCLLQDVKKEVERVRALLEGFTLACFSLRTAECSLWNMSARDKLRLCQSIAVAKRIRSLLHTAGFGGHTYGFSRQLLGTYPVAPYDVVVARADTNFSVDQLRTSEFVAWEELREFRRWVAGESDSLNCIQAVVKMSPGGDLVVMQPGGGIGETIQLSVCVDVATKIWDAPFDAMSAVPKVQAHRNRWLRFSSLTALAKGLVVMGPLEGEEERTVDTLRAVLLAVSDATSLPRSTYADVAKVATEEETEAIGQPGGSPGTEAQLTQVQLLADQLDHVQSELAEARREVTEIKGDLRKLLITAVRTLKIVDTEEVWKEGQDSPSHGSDGDVTMCQE